MTNPNEPETRTRHLRTFLPPSSVPVPEPEPEPETLAITLTRTPP